MYALNLIKVICLSNFKAHDKTADLIRKSHPLMQIQVLTNTAARPQKPNCHRGVQRRQPHGRNICKQVRKRMRKVYQQHLPPQTNQQRQRNTRGIRAQVRAMPHRQCRLHQVSASLELYPRS